MVNFNLRPYQQEAVAAIFREWEEGRRKTLLSLPTGCGKTVVFCDVIRQLVKQGKRVLVLAHRGELLDQAADKLSKSTGLGCAVEKAEHTCHGEWFRVVVGSVQTLMRQKRLNTFEPDYFDAIIIDEAHHILSDSYQRVLAHFAEADILGVTATSDRGDKRDLGEYFDSLAYEYSLVRAIKDGYLSPIKAMTIPLSIDIKDVAQQSGDFQAAALGSALDPYLERIADEMAQHCKDRKTVAFLPLIATSQRFCEVLNARGFRAAEVNGQSEDRAEVLADFEAGKYNVLCNSMLLTEGWDCPPVDCIVPLRPTKIRSLFVQMVGRGTRLCPGKENLLVLDFLWATGRMDLCRPACIVADTPEVAAKMTEAINDEPCAVDLLEAEVQAESDCIADREEALAKKLAEQRNKKRKLVDPLQFEISIAAEDLVNYVPAFGYEMEPVSDKQKAALEKAGIFPDEIQSAGEASLILDRIQRRYAEGLTTARQIRQLEGRGFQHVGQWDFESARKLIARIAASGWRTPAGIDPATYKPVTKQGEVA